MNLGRSEQEAIHDRERAAAPLAIRGELAPGGGDLRIHRQDALGELGRQLMDQPALEGQSLRAAPEQGDAFAESHPGSGY